MKKSTDIPIRMTELVHIRNTSVRKINFLPLTESIKIALTKQAENRAYQILHAESIRPESIQGQCFYVSATGNDSSNGLSPESAWKSIARLHQAQSDNTIRAGDAVFFERGSVFNSEFPTRWSGDYALQLKSHVTYSAYGVGKKPLFLNCIFGNGEQSWRASAYPNVWEFTHAIRGRYSDVGNIIFDNGKAYGIKVTPADPNHPYEPGYRTVNSGIVTNGMEVFSSGGDEFTDPGCLKHNLEFFHDAQTGKLFLFYKQGNPGAEFSEIVISRRGNIIRGSEPSVGITLDNLSVKFTGSHGVNFSEACGVVVQNCEFGWIGGSLQELDDFNTVRYGNAVENWGGCDGFTVRSCVIYQCYDAELTSQTTQWDPAKPCVMKNIDFSDNVLAYSNSPIELWNPNPPDKTGKPYVNTAENVSVRRNYMLYSGYHFGHQRPYKNGSFGCLGGKAEGQIFLNSIMEENYFLFSSSLMHYSRCIQLNHSETGIRLNKNIYAAELNKKYYLKSCLDPVTGRGEARLYPYNAEIIGTLALLGMEPEGTFYWYEGSLFPEEKEGVFLLDTVTTL